jgi:H+/Cl- antiporter ClcA
VPDPNPPADEPDGAADPADDPAAERDASVPTRLLGHARGLVRLDLRGQLRLALHLGRWIVLGAASGVLAGLASAGFLESLDWATRTRQDHGWLLFLLPVAGLATGLAYHYGAGRAVAGNNLLLDEIHEPRAWVPRRMAPLIYVGTVVGHVFGASVGREGSALQMSGSLTDGFARLIRLQPADRRLLLVAAIAGGFGSVFGVPLAGCVFALEVQSRGRVRYDAIVPAMTASVVGDLVVRGLGVHHEPVPTIGAVDLTAPLVGKVALAGIAFGLCAMAFAELTETIRELLADFVAWPPLRPVIGAGAVIGLTYLVGSRDYLGLSTPLVTRSLAGGTAVIGAAFALKLLFTATSLGSGFVGGEVTPLVVMGATLGATLAHPLGVPVPLLASIGFVSVFAGASSTPLACTIMGVELFGSGDIVLLAVGCVASYVVMGERSIYGTQRSENVKALGYTAAPPRAEGEILRVHHADQRRRPWFPSRRRPDGPA